jgi:hypothetical protein
MRVLVSILFLAVAAFAQDPQALPPSAQAPDNLSIPAQLSRTIDTNKCKSGDLVELRTLEPVLIANGLVMPENAKLDGRILGAASRQNNQPSWLVLLVEKAEWKQHTLPLHAFVAAHITVKAQLSRQMSNMFESAINQSDTLRRRHAVLPQSTSGSQTPSGLGHVQDATADRNEGPLRSYQGLDDLRLLKANNGTVFLVSQNPHLKLPSGTMFMLRNQATTASTPADEQQATEHSQ